MAFSVTHARVAHYDDVIDYMARDAVDKFRATHGRDPLPAQVKFLKKELVRYVVIRHDIPTAQKLTIDASNILLS